MLFETWKQFGKAKLSLKLAPKPLIVQFQAVACAGRLPKPVTSEPIIDSVPGILLFATLLIAALGSSMTRGHTPMKRLWIVLNMAVVLAACQSSDTPRFHRMTPLELQAYNETVELPDMVYCFEEVRIGSMIKKKYCLTLFEITTALDNTSSFIGTINYGGSGPAFRGAGPGLR